MPTQGYFSYIRVSTQKQGNFGTSLAQQQSAIESYARRYDLNIIKHFEERETAAKQGRPVFLDLLDSLKKGKAKGIVIHKIDRSARNLKDWAALGSLIDEGVAVGERQRAHSGAQRLTLLSLVKLQSQRLRARAMADHKLWRAGASRGEQSEVMLAIGRRQGGELLADPACRNGGAVGQQGEGLGCLPGPVQGLNLFAYFLFAEQLHGALVRAPGERHAYTQANRRWRLG